MKYIKIFEQFDDNIAKKRAMCRYVHDVKKTVSSYEEGGTFTWL